MLQLHTHTRTYAEKSQSSECIGFLSKNFNFLSRNFAFFIDLFDMILPLVFMIVFLLLIWHRKIVSKKWSNSCPASARETTAFIDIQPIDTAYLEIMRESDCGNWIGARRIWCMQCAPPTDTQIALCLWTKDARATSTWQNCVVWIVVWNQSCFFLNSFHAYVPFVFAHVYI